MDRRVEKLLAELTLEEKVALTAGVDMWHTPPIERLAIPAFRMTDGPAGARGTRVTGGPTSACFPCGTALAATWDVALVEEVGRHLGEEARSKGAHLLLAPTVNLHRHPLAGRNFECFSEDPWLTAAMAGAYIGGVQSTGVGACIKHYVANDSEFERFTISSEVPERALRELYLWPFEHAVSHARPVAVMAAYNKVAGTWCSEHPHLLDRVLRQEWGYDGLVVSDWWATHSTVEAANAGLDLEMPGPTLHRGDALVGAVRAGELSAAVVDRLVGHVLVAMARTGALDHGPGAETSADSPERRAAARRAATDAIVLLRNEVVGGAAVLPLRPEGTVAVLGPNADALTVMGGGSAGVAPPYAVTVLEGLRRALEATEAHVVHEPGCRGASSVPRLDLRWVTTAAGEPGLDVEYIAGADPTGTAVAADVARRPFLSWTGAPVPGLDGAGGWCTRITARLTVPEGGQHRVQLQAAGQARMRVDGVVVAETPEDPGGAQRAEGSVELTAGAHHRLEIDYIPAPGPMIGIDVRVGRVLPEGALDAAVAAAAGAGAAVVVVGHDDRWESEGRDRRSLELPAPQDDLVRRVAAVNPRTVVVLNTGAPVAMPWAGEVASIVQLWFAGQEQGTALADVLLGTAEPAGRLPTTFPARLQDTPAFTGYPGEFGEVRYGEGLYTGYRWYDARGIAPLFPFGHGLSYTTFSWGPLSATVDGDDVIAEVEITNTGRRPGAEVVQLYVTPLAPAADRPPKELRGFAKLWLAPGEAATARVVLDRRAFAHWDPTDRAWVVARADYVLAAASSATSIRSTTRVTLTG